MRSFYPPRRLWPLLVFVLLLGLTFATYWPGLSGPFLLDDWGTLPKLGDYGPVNNLTTLVSYLTSGNAGPGGRPIALLSFLLNAHDWPAPPWWFKFTNVLFLLLDGCVLAWLLHQLGRVRGLDPRKCAWAAVLGAGLWMVHPLFVSTTLYVVQRMAMLAALFVFAGLGCYVKGRLRLAAGQVRRGYALMVGGLVGGLLLGFFSKENAGLLPLLALVLELTVLQNPGSGTRNQGPDDERIRRPHRIFRIVFLWLPSALIVAYLLWQLRHPEVLVPGRDFSIGTRLLTEPRVLVRYLYLLVIPHAWTHGLYTVIPLSRGLWHPWTTLPAIVVVLALIASAFSLRRRWPVLAAAIMFFFAGQLIESTTLPLELYYEHRNFLPAALLFWPLALWWVTGKGQLLLRRATLVAVFAVLLCLTALRADLWGHPDRLALQWMRLNPNSSRAVIFGTDTLEAEGRTLAAYGRLVVASHAKPDDISIALARVDAACGLRGAGKPDVNALTFAVRHDWTRFHLLYKNLSEKLDRAKLCTGMGLHVMQHVVSVAGTNPNFQHNRTVQQKIGFLRGRLFLRENEPHKAYSVLAHAVALDPGPATVLNAGSWLMDANEPHATLALLDMYAGLPHHTGSGWSMPRLHRMWLTHIGWYRESLRLMRQSARSELEHAGDATGHPRSSEPTSRRMR